VITKKDQIEGNIDGQSEVQEARDLIKSWKLVGDVTFCEVIGERKYPPTICHECNGRDIAPSKNSNSPVGDYYCRRTNCKDSKIYAAPTIGLSQLIETTIENVNDYAMKISILSLLSHDLKDPYARQIIEKCMETINIGDHSTFEQKLFTMGKDLQDLCDYKLQIIDDFDIVKGRIRRYLLWLWKSVWDKDFGPRCGYSVGVAYYYMLKLAKRHPHKELTKLWSFSLDQCQKEHFAVKFQTERENVWTLAKKIWNTQYTE